MLRDNIFGELSIINLTEYVVNNAQDIFDILKQGYQNRTTGVTYMNEHSSRSHAICTLYLNVITRENEEEKQFISKFHLVDLAGSERVKKTKVKTETHKRLKEIP